MNKALFGNINYEYADTKMDENQYEGMESNGIMMPAIYRRAVQNEYRGNPFIEALPPPVPDAVIYKMFRKEISGYDPSDMKMPQYIRKQKMRSLTSYRYPLSFDKVLCSQMDAALITSYGGRYVSDGYGANSSQYEVRIGGVAVDQDKRLMGNSAGSTNGGFALLGFSGCGKSSAIEILTSYYPQVITHKTTNGRQIQVIYLVINCIGNSNLRSLYDSMAYALDCALKDGDFYEAQMKKKRLLSDKADYARDLVEIMSIGILIFDEIQLIDFSDNKENSFESLMTLSNRTKVAIGVIGTEDAKEKMFSRLRTARRIGCEINADFYCKNQKYFSKIIHDIWYYQWYDEPVKISDEIITTLCECTHCIISQLICLILAMHEEYFLHTKRPIINKEFICSVQNKYMKGIKLLLDGPNTPESQKEIDKSSKEFISRYKAMDTDQLQIEEQMNMIDSEDMDNNLRLFKERVLRVILDVDDYSQNALSREFDKIYTTVHPKSERDMVKALRAHMESQTVQKKAALSKIATKEYVFSLTG